jgi:hypothetical protein
MMVDILQNNQIIVENASESVCVIIKKKRGKSERVQIDPGDHVILDVRTLDMEFIHEQVGTSPYLRYRAKSDFIDPVSPRKKVPKKQETPDEVIAKGLLQDVTKEEPDTFVAPSKKEDLEDTMMEGVNSLTEYIKGLQDEAKFLDDEEEENKPKKRKRRTKKEIEAEEAPDEESPEDVISQVEDAG